MQKINKITNFCKRNLVILILALNYIKSICKIVWLILSSYFRKY